MVITEGTFCNILGRGSSPIFKITKKILKTPQFIFLKNKETLWG